MADRRCIACSESIPGDASLCKECGSYQRAWRNELRYASTTIGVVVVSASFLLFATDAFLGIRTNLWPHTHIRVLELDSRRTLAIGNFGDTPIHVDVLTLQTQTRPHWRSLRIDVAQSIPVGTVLAHDLTPTEASGASGIPRGLTQEEYERIRRELLSESSPCYFLVFYPAESRAISELDAQIGSDRLEFEAAGSLTYYDTDGSRGTLKVSATAVVYFKIQDGCRNWERVRIERLKQSEQLGESTNKSSPPTTPFDIIETRHDAERAHNLPRLRLTDKATSAGPVRTTIGSLRRVDPDRQIGVDFDGAHFVSSSLPGTFSSGLGQPRLESAITLQGASLTVSQVAHRAIS